MSSDYLPDTPLLARSYCPGCEPDADPFTEILDINFCEKHYPKREGQDDEIVTAQAYMSGSGEAGGYDNQAYCDFFHRGIVPTRT